MQLGLSAKRKIIIVGFLIVPVILLLLFCYYPALKLLQYSFTSWDGISPTLTYIGLKNYTRVFTDSRYYTPFLHNGILFIAGLVQILLAFYLAIILNNRLLRGRNAFRSLIFMPYILNSVAIAFIFSFFLDPNSGVLNSLIRNIGFPNFNVDWFGNAAIVNWVMGFIALWKYTGYMMIIFLGALQSVPLDLYEASYIDGANAFQQMRFITLPSIRNIVGIIFFLNLNGVVGAFEFQFIMWPMSSPLGIADTFMTKTVGTAFNAGKYGLASSMGVILVVIVGVITVVQNKLIMRED